MAAAPRSHNFATSSRLLSSPIGPAWSVNATLQAGLAARFGGDYGFALALVAGIVAVTIIILAALGSEARGVKFGTAGPPRAGTAIGSAL